MPQNTPCPDCGFLMTRLDKQCARCAAQKKAEQNPYVAFQKAKAAQSPAAPVDVSEPLEETLAPAERFSPPSDEAAPPPSPPVRRQGSAVPVTLGLALLLFLLYHLLVVHPQLNDLQRADDEQRAKITALQKQSNDLQAQVDDLRRVVNYNADAANSSRY